MCVCTCLWVKEITWRIWRHANAKSSCFDRLRAVRWGGPPQSSFWLVRRAWPPAWPSCPAWPSWLRLERLRWMLRSLGGGPSGTWWSAASCSPAEQWRTPGKPLAEGNWLLRCRPNRTRRSGSTRWSKPNGSRWTSSSIRKTLESEIINKIVQ